MDKPSQLGTEPNTEKSCCSTRYIREQIFNPIIGNVAGKHQNYGRFSANMFQVLP